MNKMPEIHGSPQPPKDWASRVQIHGVLSKKTVGNQSNKWTKRFFVLKDGFLLYYDTNERKDYERKEFFNIHPKGVFPLGNASFKSCREPHQPFSILITSTEICGQLVLAAESDYERDKWIEVMERSCKVTYKNTQLGDEMIRRLERQGLEMAIEKQDYIDRLQEEVLALSEEKMRTEELERVNQELEKEKSKLESFTKDIQEEYDKIKEELDETNFVMDQVESDRVALSQSLRQQQQKLKDLDADKTKILKELEASVAEQTSLSQEKQSLSERTEHLQAQLADIETRTQVAMEESTDSEMRLKDNQERLEQLEFEKLTISEHAQELQSTIHDLQSQKEMTEKELKEEIRARISAEERLKEAERSLHRLDHAVEAQKDNIESEAKEEMTVSVRKLKVFFEDLATEAKISSDKPIIMRNTLTARKTIARRAKTVRYAENRKRSSNNTMSCDLSQLRPKTQIRRATTSVHVDSRSSLSLPSAVNHRLSSMSEEQF